MSPSRAAHQARGSPTTATRSMRRVLPTNGLDALGLWTEVSQIPRTAAGEEAAHLLIKVPRRQRTQIQRLRIFFGGRGVCDES